MAHGVAYILVRSITVELAAADVSRYSYTIATHYDAGQYYSAWLDFRLRIHNATQHDSGIYRYVLHEGICSIIFPITDACIQQISDTALCN